MRSISLASTATLVALASECVVDATSAAAANFPRASTGNGFISLPVGTVDRPRTNSKRQNGGQHAFVTVLENMDFFYATVVSIGSPAQNVTVLVDTGSSELWVNPECDTVDVRSQRQQCESFGQYDPNDSNTPPVGPFGSEQINYGDPSDESTLTSVNIEYYADTVALGAARVSNQTFGVVVNSTGQTQGIMGLAPDLRGGFDSDQPYSLLLDSMAQQGVINSRVFAMDLRHASSETGAIIYGGIDRNKFIGSLEARPIIRGLQGEYRLAVELNTLGLTNSRGRSQSFELQGDDTNVMLDSGTTLTRMNSNVALPILRAIGAQDDGEGYYVVRCSMRQAGGSVDFGFGNKTVRVPYSDFIIDVGDPTYCYVGMVITQDQQILGDSVLRAGYFVFDWDNEQVHIAQAANCGNNDILTVGSGTDSVPSSTGNCASSDAAFTGGSGSEPTGTTSGPSQPYTTVYTVTSCPGFDQDCRTGRVTTQTVGTAAVTTTAGGGGGGGEGGNGGGDDNAAGHVGVSGLMATVVGVFAGVLLMV